MNTTISEIKERLFLAFTCFSFDYHGVPCGVDPISSSKYIIWYGDKDTEVNSVSDVFAIPFWDGKTLSEIFDQIDINEY